MTEIDDARNYIPGDCPLSWEETSEANRSALSVEEQRELNGECVDCGEKLGTDDVEAGDSRCEFHAQQDAEDFYVPDTFEEA